jgi:hypothetical protein
MLGHRRHTDQKQQRTQDADLKREIAVIVHLIRPSIAS